MKQFFICGLREIPNHSWRGVTHVISLVDAEFTDVIQREGQQLPDVVNNADHLFEGYYDKPTRLELQFDDVSDPDPWSVEPNEDHVRQILEFAAGLPDDAVLLVHCHAGISRSTAAATLVLMQKHPEKSVDEVFEMVLAVRPQAYPNRLILRLGANLLGREWEMRSTHNKRFNG